MLGRPVYAKMNNGTAAIIMGNGYNSTSGTAALYIFLLNTSGALTSVVKLDTHTTGDNGLATPGVIDANGDGKVDYVYAGDLQGNVWQFDVSGATTASWKVGLSPLPLTPNPLFKARDASNNPQPITAPITVAVNTDLADPNAGKRFLFFGTGSYFRTGDPTNAAIQTWYGVIDEGSVIADRSNLQPRTVEATGTFAGKPVRAFSVAGTNDMAGKSGWYLDFTMAPPGERMVTEPVAYKLAVNVLVASSIIPSGSDPCIPGGTGYVNALNPFTGGSLGVGILDVNNNKNYKDDVLSGLFIGSVDLGVGLPSRPTLIGNRLVVGGTNPDDKNPISDVGVNLGFAPVKGRISWREIIKD
jgi:type IV pilus assembly protein PilY1